MSRPISWTVPRRSSCWRPAGRGATRFLTGWSLLLLLSNVTPPLLEPFRALFAGRETFHGQYGDGPEAEKKIQTLKIAAPLEAWVRHLEGVGPYLGVVPIRLDNTCLFGAIDVDDDDIDHQGLAEKVKELNLPLLVCRSKSGGAHLYVFFEAPIPAPIVVKTLKSWAKTLGFLENSDGRPIEVFPKQTMLRVKDSGNWINLPYYGSDASTRKAVSPTGDLLSLQEFIAVAELQRVRDATHLASVQPHTDDIFGDGPPCLQTLHIQGFAEGTRNSGLYNIAIFFRMAYETDWKAKVEQYSQNSFQPPLSSREVDSVIASVERKDYSYNCDELPIQPHCQKALCNKRKYGVAKLRSRLSIKSFPSMTALRKIETDPPRWLVEIAGIDVELTTDDITQLVRLRRVVFERLNLVLPIIRAQDYDDILRDLLAKAVVITAPDDAGHRGQFIELVNQFLARRKMAESKEDVLQGLPYEENARIYFRSVDLLSFLERRRFTRYAIGEMYTIMRSLGALHGSLRTKKQVVRVWTMPLPDVDVEQTEDFDPLPAEKLGSNF